VEEGCERQIWKLQEQELPLSQGRRADCSSSCFFARRQQRCWLWGELPPCCAAATHLTVKPRRLPCCPVGQPSCSSYKPGARAQQGCPSRVCAQLCLASSSKAVQNQGTVWAAAGRYPAALAQVWWHWKAEGGRHHKPASCPKVSASYCFFKVWGYEKVA